MNRLMLAEQFRRAVQLFAAMLNDDLAMEIATVYPSYVTGKNYKTGDIFSYGTNSVGDPQLYRVAQDHTSQENWTPDTAPALYTPIGIGDAGYPIWAQPTGAHDAYNAGDIVWHSDVLWQSAADGNIWEPGVYGWTEFTAE